MDSPSKSSQSIAVHGSGPSTSQEPKATAKPLIPPIQGGDEAQLFGSSGLLTPFCLFPLIYQGTPESLCLYSLLVPLCWWLTNSVPRCVAALAPFVTLPALRTLGADEVAAAFLTPASLRYLIFLVIVTVSHTSGRLIPRLSFTLCSKYGLQVLPLFLWLTALTYMMSLFIPKAAVAILLNLAVDKILTCIHDCDLDRAFSEEEEPREVQLSVQPSPEESGWKYWKAEKPLAPPTDRSLPSPTAGRIKEVSKHDKTFSVSSPSGNPSTSTPSLAVVDARANASRARPLTSFKSTIHRNGTEEPKQDSLNSLKPLQPPSAKNAVAVGDKQVADEDITDNQGRKSAATGDLYERKSSENKSTTSTRRKKRRRRGKSLKSPKSPNDTASLRRHRKRSHASKSKGVIEAPRGPKVTPQTLPLDDVAEPSTTVPEPVIEATQPTIVGPDDLASEVRRPSILRKPTRSRSWVSLLGVKVAADKEARAASTVEFGHDECQFISPEEEQEHEYRLRLQRSEDSRRASSFPDVPEAMAGLRNPNSAARAERAGVSAAAVPPGLTSSGATSSITLPPHWQTGSVSGASLSLLEAKLEDCSRSHMSQRTAFLLCCSLVTMTASLSSMLTVAARGALVQHAIVKRGMKGVLSWFLLVTPTALVATASCCVALYMLHLRHRPLYSKEDTQDICLAATTALNKLGPIRGGELLLACAFMCYFVFVFLGPLCGYSSRKHMLSFLAVLLIVFSVIPTKCGGFFERKHRLIVWSEMSQDVPWTVIVIHCTVQLSTSVFRNNKLLPTFFKTLGSEFWGKNPLVVNQVVIGTIGSVLAEAVNNNHLCDDIVPLVMEIAEETNVPPVAYVVPATVGSCTNMILPIHLPMIVANEVIEAMIGMLAKVISVASSIISVNIYGSRLIPWSAALLANSTVYYMEAFDSTEF